MTIEEFRANPLMRDELAAALTTPAFVAFVEIYDREFRGVDANTTAPEIASVRLLSARAGFEAFLKDAEEATRPVVQVEDTSRPADWQAGEARQAAETSPRKFL